MSLLGESALGGLSGWSRDALFFQANTNHPVLHLVNYDIGFGIDAQSFARNTVQVHIVIGYFVNVSDGSSLLLSDLGEDSEGVVM